MEYPKFYTFDLNRRIYEKNEKGFSTGGPIYSEHFTELVVIDETDKEYICEHDQRINKKSMKSFYASCPREKSAVYTEAEREAMIWRNENRYKLIRKVEHCNNIDILKQIAALVGYQS